MNDRQHATADRLSETVDLIIRHGADAASPVEIYGFYGWESTPFQFADNRCCGGGSLVEMVAGWQAGDCGAKAANAAVVYDDGSATTYVVEFSDDEDGDRVVDATEDEELDYEDEFTEALKPHGDFACGSSIVEAADQWRDAGFDADKIGDWIEARVWDADVADTLKTMGVNPDQIRSLTWPDLGYEDDDSPIGDTVGYAVANRDISVEAVVAAINGDDNEE